MHRHSQHLGTYRATAYRRATQPTYSLTHALISGVTMAGFMAAALVWVASL